MATESRTRIAIARPAVAAFVFHFLLLASPLPAASAAGTSAEPVREPMPVSVEIGGKRYRLDGMMIRPGGNGPYPLALINHGSCGRACRKKRSPNDLARQAEIFAGWGYAAYILMRRDNGASDGPYAEGFGGCNRQRYDQAAHSAASDMAAALGVLRNLPYVDPAAMIAVGQSGGGIGVIALTAKNIAGLRAVINFAGGRGGGCVENGAFDNAKARDSFRALGERSRLPTLWVYTENDENWGADFPKSWRAAFAEAGGMVEFVLVPPHGRRGHGFFYRPAAIPIWRPVVERFLTRALPR